jgi:hypothetical protein
MFRHGHYYQFFSSSSSFLLLHEASDEAETSVSRDGNGEVHEDGKLSYGQR